MSAAVGERIGVKGPFGCRTFIAALRSGPFREPRLRVAETIALGWARVFLCLIPFAPWLIVVGVDYRATVPLAGVLLLYLFGPSWLGPSWASQKDRVRSILRTAVLEDHYLIELGIRTGLFKLVEAGKGEMGSDLVLYLARVQFIRDKVFGSLAPQIDDLLTTIDQIDRNLHPEEAEPLYRQTLALYREGYRHYQSASPERYTSLVLWKDQRTLHGRGRPTVEEALEEAYIQDIMDEYPDCLRHLAEKHRKAGRCREAEEAESRLREVEEFFRGLHASQTPASQHSVPPVHANEPPRRP